MLTPPNVGMKSKYLIYKRVCKVTVKCVLCTERGISDVLLNYIIVK